MKVNYQLLGIGAGVLGGEWLLRKTVMAVGKAGLGFLWDPSEHYTWEDLTTTNTGLPNIPTPMKGRKLRNLTKHILDPLWDALGPVTVTSAFRSKVVNLAVKGDPDSQHVKGEAADLTVPGYTALQLAQKIYDLGLPYDKLIWYDGARGGHVHVSYGPRNRREVRHAPAGSKSYPLWSF